MNQSLLSQLDLVEHQFNEVAAILASDNADQVTAASALLQSLTIEFMRAVGPLERLSALAPADMERMKALATGLRLLRDNLSRRTAYVNQALKIVVPTATKSTYAGAGSPFAAVTQQSGQFKVLAA